MESVSRPVSTDSTDEVPEESGRLITAFYFGKHVVGVAAYEEITSTIYCDSFAFSLDDCDDLLYNLKFSLTPSLILLNPTVVANRDLLQTITKGIDDNSKSFNFKALKSSVWNEISCVELIHTKVYIRGSTMQSTFHYVSSSIDMNSQPLLKALNALLSFIQDVVFQLDDGKIEVSYFKPFPQQKYMYMDTNTFQALQIFHEDIHPNWLKGKGKNKEGFSLFGLMDRTCSVLGRRKLREWMAKPLCDYQEIEKRKAAIAFVANPSHLELIRSISHHLKKFHDVPQSLMRIKKVISTHIDWIKIHSSAKSFIYITSQLMEYYETKILQEREEHFFQQVLVPNVTNQIRAIEDTLRRVIDFEASNKLNEIVVQTGYDLLLDEKRQLYDDLEGYLIEAAQKVLDCTPYLESLSVEYVPQLGYMVVLSEESAKILHEQNAIADSGCPTATLEHNEFVNSFQAPVDSNMFYYVFGQSEKKYFKHAIVNELDEQLGDVKTDIMDRQKFIVLQLEDELLSIEPALLEMSYAMATLDVFLSLGTIAREHRLVPPTIVEDPVVVVKNGRHLLQELTVDNFVPNDTYLTDEKNTSLILGPNSSGKSIYLKQVGIIVYLCHIGSWVPCDHAIIGLTDKILTRIASVETISAPVSSFMSDLHQMNKMLQSRTPRSLCLIDEFGKGTNPIDGMSLLSAIIHDFVEKKSKVFVVLHFSEIIHDTLIPLDSINVFNMEVYPAPSKENILLAEDITPLFKLKYGLGSLHDSNGIGCAQHIGLPTYIIDRAKTIKEYILQKDEHRDMPLSYRRKRNLINFFLQEEHWAEADSEAIAAMESMLMP